MRRWICLALFAILLACRPVAAAPTVINPGFLPHADNTTQGAVILSGDITGSYNAIALASITTAATKGILSRTTIDAKGRVTVLAPAAIATPTTTVTISTSSDIYECNATGGGFTATLPAASTVAAYFVQKSDSSANAVTIARAGSDTINGATSLALSVQYESVLLVADGAGHWYVLSHPLSGPTGAAGGDLTGTYPNPTLAAVISASSVGDSTHWPVVTYDAKGRLTSVTSQAAPTALPPNGAAGGSLQGTYPNPTLANTAVTPATYGDSSHVAVITVGADGRVTGVTNTSITGGAGSSFATDAFAESGATTSYTLSHSAAGGLVQVFFDGIQQPAANYTVSGTSLTIAAGVNLSAFLTVTASYNY